MVAGQAREIKEIAPEREIWEIRMKTVENKTEMELRKRLERIAPVVLKCVGEET